jgi:hypothetical protein
MISAVSHPESSEARNTTTLAMSAGVPMRPRGVIARECFSKSLPMPSSPKFRRQDEALTDGRRTAYDAT